MKRILLFTSAIGLCLTAPAFAQSYGTQPSTQTPSAQPSQAAPSSSNQQSQDRDRDRQRPTSGQAQRQSQPSSSSGQAQNQQPQNPPSGQAQSQQPSGPSNAQAPSSNQQQRAGDNQNQRDNRNQRDQAQRDRQPNASGDNKAATRDMPADRQRANPPVRDQQMSQDRQRGDQRRDAQNSRSGDRNRQDARSRDDRRNAANVRLNDNQRTRIASVIRTANVRAVDVNFSIGIGVLVPTTVALYPLPASIIEVVPRYRSYSYFVTREQIVIVEPRTKKIVQVIPQGGGAQAQSSPGGRARAQATGRRVTFSDEQRRIIRERAIVSGPVTTGSSAIVVEEELPAMFELQEFPAEIVTEVPEIRTYRYIRRDNDVYVVDPPSRRVIEIIR